MVDHCRDSAVEGIARNSGEKLISWTDDDPLEQSETVVCSGKMVILARIRSGPVMQ
jgi:hypothetical protein